jgi:oligo-1,6-glucosidase
MLYTFLLTQRATPYIYNGDEIGMTNIRFTNVDQYNDLQTRNRYYLALKESKAAAAAYLQMQAELSRDNSRTPMQWDNTTHAGFTSGKPWLPVNSNYTSTNVKAEDTAANSVLSFVRKMIKLRKENKEVLVYGKYTLLDKDNKDVYAYLREAEGKKFLVLLNFTKNHSSFNAGTAISKAKILISNYVNPSTGNILKPYEAIICEL